MNLFKIICTGIFFIIFLYIRGLSYEFSDTERKIIEVTTEYRLQMIDSDKSEDERDKIIDALIKECKLFIEKYPDHSLAYIELATAYQDKKDYKMAEELLEKVLDLEKGETAKSLKFRAVSYKNLAFNYTRKTYDISKLEELENLISKADDIIEKAIDEFKERLQKQPELIREIEKNIDSLKEAKDYISEEAEYVKQKLAEKASKKRLLKTNLQELTAEERIEAIEKRLLKIRQALAIFYSDVDFKRTPDSLGELVPEYLDFLPPGDWDYDPETLEIKSKSHPDL